MWLDQNYYPKNDKSTVYFLNHHSWWDGIIPLLLNEFRFKQRGRAIMDEVQIKKYPFFKKLGAYSIDRSNPRNALKSLDLTVDILTIKGTSTFIYPQGKITEPSEPLVFESGIKWLYEKCHEVDFVPVALHQHTLFSDKPELFIKTGTPVDINRSLPGKQKVHALEDALKELLARLRVESTTVNPYPDRLI